MKLASKEDIDKISHFLDTYYREDFFISKNTITRMVTGEVDPKFGKQRKPIKVFLLDDELGILALMIITLTDKKFSESCLNNTCLTWKLSLINQFINLIL